MRLKLPIAHALLALSITACSLIPLAKPTAIPSATPIPSPTPIPTSSTPLAILLAPSNMDKSTSEAYQKVVYDLALKSGIRFQLRNSLTAQDVDPTVRVVIALPPDPGIAALAAAAPNVQFLAIDMPGINAAGNVSVLATSSQVAAAAFVAGYAAAIMSDDNRAGMILPQENPDAQLAARAFSNGMSYYCGVCNTFRIYSDQNGLALRFPQFAQIPANENAGNFGGWANHLVGDLKVSALYVYPDPRIAVRQLWDALGQTGAAIVGGTTPDPRPGGWAVGIRLDETKAIERAWADLLAGKGGQAVPSPLGLADVDPNLMTPGKERLVQQVLDDLQAGRISTGVGP